MRWVKIPVELFDDPRLEKLRVLMGMSPMESIGVFTRLIICMDELATNIATEEEIINWSQQSSHFVTALLDVGFINQCGVTNGAPVFLFDFIPKKSRKRRKSSVLVASTNLWENYRKAYFHRYQSEPLRNAKVNSQLKRLVEQVGMKEAELLIVYYLKRSDAQYVNSSHDPGLCLMHAQKLMTEMNTGKVITFSTARKMERKATNDQALQDYLQEGDHEPDPAS